MRGDGLLAVQVAEGHVAEPAEQLRGDLADTADGDVALGFAGRSPGDPAVRHDDAALDAAGVGVGPDAGDRVPEHPGVPAGEVRAVLARGQLGADGVRLEVRHPVHGHRAVGVLEHDRPGQRAGPGAQVHARLLQQPAAEPEPARRVVVAADQHDARAGVVQPEQGVLAQLDGVHRRHRTVVDVPGDQDRVHLLGAGHLHQVIEECRLRRPQIRAVQRPAQVPVRGVQQSHGPDPSPGHRHYAGVRADGPARIYPPPWSNAAGVYAEVAYSCCVMSQQR